MQIDHSPTKPGLRAAARSGCEEHNCLLEDYGASVRELLYLHEEQWSAIISGDDDCCRFDILIHVANERKQSAKYAYLRHVETHGCLEL